MTPLVPVKQKQSSRSTRSRRVRPRRDFKAMEQRRMYAARLFERGVIPAEIARRVGVRHQIVSQWRKAWREGGRDALRAAGRAGRRPKLTDAQLTEVEQALAKGAEANGYLTDLWTLPRVAETIQRLTGVSYHPGHVWYVLRDQLDWTWQRPARRAVERNDEAIEQWVKKRWPQLKKRARRQNALIVFEDESGVSLLPSVRATWAPRGHTPVLRHRFVWKRLSIASALVYEPHARDAHLVFELRPGAYNTATLIEFLTFLHEFEQHRCAGRRSGSLSAPRWWRHAWCSSRWWRRCRRC